MTRRAHENFIFPDPHDGDMPLNYFLWAIQGNGRTIVVDTGFTEEAARRRGRTYLRSPAAALESIGIRAGEVAEVIITHLHYDHAGALDLFSGAIFHVRIPRSPMRPADTCATQPSIIPSMWRT